jgi:hypothetical protein
MTSDFPSLTGERSSCGIQILRRFIAPDAIYKYVQSQRGREITHLVWKNGKALLCVFERRQKFGLEKVSAIFDKSLSAGTRLPIGIYECAL